MKPEFNDNISSVRLRAGLYALSKLAGAGLTFTGLALLRLALPHADTGWLSSPAYNVYSYALTVSLLADGLLRLLGDRPWPRVPAVYAVAGLTGGLWLALDQGSGWTAGAFSGMALLLFFRLAQLAGERVPELLPVFALFVPLLCLLAV